MTNQRPKVFLTRLTASRKANRMAEYGLENRLVIAVASSALFDLTESDAIFSDRGIDEYRRYQTANRDVSLAPGVAFPFVRRVLALNEHLDGHPVEVILLSRNDADTGLRVFSSIRTHGLDITRASFLSGESPFSYIPAFDASLFLSANREDVANAMRAGYPAGLVLKSQTDDSPDDGNLRVAFDFDGVLADDEAEKVYRDQGVDEYRRVETARAQEPHNWGLLMGLLKKLSWIQGLENARQANDPAYKRHLRIAIITARNAPAHERAVTTLRDADVHPDEVFFLGGVDKSRILQVFRPHMFFDDQMVHLEDSSRFVPSVHIPFGVGGGTQE